jgi:hypothetical protein
MNFQSSKNNHSNISHISIKIKEEPNLNNFSYHIQYNPSQTDNHDMFIYLKIKDFDKFLNIQRAYETGLFKFYIPRWDLNLIGKATLIPNLEKKNFSLKIDIVEDNRLDQFSYQEKEMDLSNVSHFSNKVNKNNNEFLCEASIGMAKLYNQLMVNDSAAYYGRMSFLIAKRDGFLSYQKDAAILGLQKMAS